jgi:hypothetical protein
LFINTGCKKKSNNQEGLFSSELAESAHETYTRYAKAADPDQLTLSDKIPKQYWTDKIKQLKPIKVYIHRGNIVVVQRTSANVEEGKYLYMPISSYAPHNGDDGFSFTSLGDDLYDFKRILK